MNSTTLNFAEDKKLQIICTTFFWYIYVELLIEGYIILVKFLTSTLQVKKNELDTIIL